MTRPSEQQQRQQFVDLPTPRVALSRTTDSAHAHRCSKCKHPRSPDASKSPNSGAAIGSGLRGKWGLRRSQFHDPIPAILYTRRLNAPAHVVTTLHFQVSTSSVLPSLRARLYPLEAHKTPTAVRREYRWSNLVRGQSTKNELLGLRHGRVPVSHGTNSDITRRLRSVCCGP